jgi:hypothetical protein
MTKTFQAPPTTEPAPSSPLASLAAGLNQTGYLGPALILEINPRDRLVLVQWTRAGQPCLSWARPALSASCQIKPGDVALALSQNLEDFYLLGLLAESAPAPHSSAAPLRTPSGASVVVGQSAGEEVIQVHSKQGALALEYHPASGKTIVNVETGDLEFVARQGSIAFHSARKISFVAHRLETVAETVVSKARNFYRTIEELTQLQTGRLRVLVKGNCHLKARDVFLKAEQDFKVDGQQIHLG